MAAARRRGRVPAELRWWRGARPSVQDRRFVSRIAVSREVEAMRERQETDRWGPAARKAARGAGSLLPRASSSARPPASPARRH